MKLLSRKLRSLLTFGALLCLCAALARSQSPGTLYTWPATGDVEAWSYNFGPNAVSLDNAIAGALRITETDGSGGSWAIIDGPNRVRESSTAAAGGTDVTGLSFLEFDLGQTGTAPIFVQFFVQASPAYTYEALGPDLPVMPGMNTYQVPLTGLSPEEAVYLRTIGLNVRDHASLGNVVWTLGEVRSSGVPLERRELVTHDIGTAENGLQGAIVNFDNAAVLGNDGGQNQTGLSQNFAGSGSLQWTDRGGSAGAAISWGNGTAWKVNDMGNTFNDRTTDLSNYERMIVRISAAEITPGAGGLLDIQAFFQVNNFNFQTAENGVTKALPIDGLFHELTFSLADLPNMNVVDQTGINLGTHAADLRINVDSIVFEIPEPSSLGLLGMTFLGYAGVNRRRGN